jgi:hypothetical protein
MCHAVAVLGSAASNVQDIAHVSLNVVVSTEQAPRLHVDAAIAVEQLLDNAICKTKELRTGEKKKATLALVFTFTMGVVDTGTIIAEREPKTKTNPKLLSEENSKITSRLLPQPELAPVAGMKKFTVPAEVSAMRAKQSKRVFI